MSDNDLLEKLETLVLALGCDYDRLSTSGQKTYAELCSVTSQVLKVVNNVGNSE